ncbi:MAG: hypothetical protein CVV53_09075 [Spirochaetae bacterium HGW-Spirochaetae-9]|nr:MAG: hypothetical protein CVV53_09075 [Spirochaetae bacterium HGW-Spirochaetae-9]
MEPQSEVTLTASALNVRGIRQTDSGRYPEAIASFTEALGMEPGMTGILFNRAEAKRLSGDVGGARADVLEALRLSPGDAEFLHALGLLAYEEDDFATAADFYRQALEAQPAFAQAWNDQGVIHFRKSNYAEARRCFEKATVIDAAMAEAWFNLADTYEELGLKAERAKALESLKKANLIADYRAESRE